jgi:hypothetical protein
MPEPLVSPTMRIEFVRAHDGKPAADRLALTKAEPQLPAVIDTKPKLPAVVNGGGVTVPFRFPRS